MTDSLSSSREAGDPEVVFVSRHAQDWQEIAATLPEPGDVAPQIAALGGAAGWILQTFLFLKRRGNDVRLSDSMPSRGIAIVHFDDVGLRSYGLNSFMVVIRADRPVADLCDIQIVQNPRAVNSPRDFFIPYWPQPGLIPRDPARGDRVARVGFVGRSQNLAEAYKDGAFERGLRELGVEFVFRSKEWWDYSDLDVVLGVRDGQESFMDSKPASKLVNSWMAGCPAVLGRESAFEVLRQSDLDFYRVSSVPEALEAIRELKEDPTRYRAMVDNGNARKRDFMADRISEGWEELLAGPVREGYAQWSRQGWVRRIFRFAMRAVRARVIGRSYDR